LPRPASPRMRITCPRPLCRQPSSKPWICRPSITRPTGAAAARAGSSATGGPPGSGATVVPGADRCARICTSSRSVSGPGATPSSRRSSSLATWYWRRASLCRPSPASACITSRWASSFQGSICSSRRPVASRARWSPPRRACSASACSAAVSRSRQRRCSPARHSSKSTCARVSPASSGPRAHSSSARAGSPADSSPSAASASTHSCCRSTVTVSGVASSHRPSPGISRRRVVSACRRLPRARASPPSPHSRPASHSRVLGWRCSARTASRARHFREAMTTGAPSSPSSAKPPNRFRRSIVPASF
jgi:hypothetical protein